MGWTAAAGKLCCAIQPVIAARLSCASKILRAGAKAIHLISNGAAQAPSVRPRARLVIGIAIVIEMMGHAAVPVLGPSVER